MKWPPRVRGAPVWILVSFSFGFLPGNAYWEEATGFMALLLLADLCPGACLLYLLDTLRGHRSLLAGLR